MAPLPVCAQAGQVQFFQAVRHSQVSCCAVGSQTYHLCDMFDVNGKPFPDVYTKKGLEELCAPPRPAPPRPAPGG